MGRMSDCIRISIAVDESSEPVFALVLSILN